MTLTRDQVKHIALLARLELTEDEITRYSEQLAEILDYFQQLQSVDTSEALPGSSLQHTRKFREDTAVEGLTKEELLTNAPDTENNQFRILPVLDQPPREKKKGK